MQCLSKKKMPEIFPPELDRNELLLREGLKWQQRIADAVCTYVDQITGIFEQLINMHEMLDTAGAAEAEGAASVLKSLLHGLRNAHTSTSETRRSTRTQLETHRGVLTACTDDIVNADKAALELRRLKEKVNLLVEQDLKKHGANVVSARVARNREKLQHATNQANDAKAKAQNSLQTCISRRGYLCKLTVEVITGTVNALRFGGWRVEVPRDSGVASDTPAYPQAQGFPEKDNCLVKRLVPLGSSSANPFDNNYRSPESGKPGTWNIKQIPEKEVSPFMEDSPSEVMPSNGNPFGRARTASGNTSNGASENNVFTRFSQGGTRSSNPFGGHDRFLDLPPRSCYVDATPVDSRGNGPDNDQSPSRHQGDVGHDSSITKGARRQFSHFLNTCMSFCSPRFKFAPSAPS